MLYELFKGIYSKVNNFSFLQLKFSGFFFLQLGRIYQLNNQTHEKINVKIPLNLNVPAIRTIELYTIYFFIFKKKQKKNE